VTKQLKVSILSSANINFSFSHPSLPSLPQPLALDVHALQAQKCEIERLLAETENRLQHL